MGRMRVGGLWLCAENVTHQTDTLPRYGAQVAAQLPGCQTDIHIVPNGPTGGVHGQAETRSLHAQTKLVHLDRVLRHSATLGDKVLTGVVIDGNQKSEVAQRELGFLGEVLETFFEDASGDVCSFGAVIFHES